MSVERSLEAWEEVQRHGQDLADRLAQGLTGLIQSHMSPPGFSWPSPLKKPFDLDLPAFHVSGQPDLAAGGVSAFLDIGSRLGQAGAEFGACLNGVVQQFFRQLPVPFRQDEGGAVAAVLPAAERRAGGGNVLGLAVEQFGDRGFSEAAAAGSSDEWGDEEGLGFDVKASGHLKRPRGIINITSTYDTRTHDVESSLVARGDLWRVEASHGGSTSGNESSPLFLIQLGPVLFVRDTTLLLPVHLSKQHLLWYGYDRKNGMHSLCPALWSKHRRWLLMSMICLNPPACNKKGTRITPMVQLPDKSFSVGVAQAIAWKRSGLMLRPSIQFSICPTFGGSNPGIRAELIHSIKEELNLIYGCSCTEHPSAFASLSLGRSKWNGHVGSSGIVVRVETPLSNIGRPSLLVQLNSGFEF
ncbi:uncharacterized protein LOC103708959 isoform X2 [Phoenix dactylifera]|uniref:Uncharacterized protein LOC103708959 isoform X2 n=1 Tax=Phoenix dactylifera TaxID=42345 RepID=A0A8B7C5V8_PHODC|nr:uncharacterized protein LOC103708959 isoform X2 [Phoenix dactylifera]